MSDKASTSQMEIDSEDLTPPPPPNTVKLEKLCKDAARAFFKEYGLISHQISSYNDFVEHGIQDLFDSLGEVNVEPGYDPSKKGESGWKYATVSFGKVKVEKPTFWTMIEGEPKLLQLKPKHARLQNMTYATPINVQTRIQVYTHERSDKAKTGSTSSSTSGKDALFMNKKVLHDETTDVTIGMLPVMVGSVLCWKDDPRDKGDCLFDSGGYFLIKGMEKIFHAQEQRCLSRIWLTDKPSWSVSYITEFKRGRVYAKLAEKGDGLNGGKYVSLFFLYATFPIWIMFFALGMKSDKEILDMIGIEDVEKCGSGLVNVILETIKEAGEQCEGFRKIEKAREFVDGLVKNSKFPPSESFDEYVDKFLFKGIKGQREKAMYLGYMVKCLLLGFSGKRKCDNKDDFRNKRLDRAGELISRELRAHIWHGEKRMVKAMQRDLCGDRELLTDDFERYWDKTIVTNGLNRAFATGAWCHPYKRSERCAGIVATLRRTNPLQMMADLRKTRQQVAYAGKAGDARYPNPSYWGKLCFLSTPDGENCGLVKNLAVTAIVSSKITGPIEDKLVQCGLVKLDEVSLTDLNKYDKVFLNIEWVGVCLNAEEFVSKFRLMRRARVINPQVEIKRDRGQREVRIFSDAGRILRPLLIVENLNRMQEQPKGGKAGVTLTFQSLMDQEIAEFIGVEEEEDIQSAWGIKQLQIQESGKPIPKFTHCEFDLSFLLGLSCGLIPFANHNFARRVLYQAEKHSQQAIGYSTTNPNIRVDTLSHQLFYPQKPLFKTFTADCLGRTDSSGKKDHFVKPEFYNGQNAIVAVNVHQGYNQEDSIVMNRASLERGMFRTEHLRSYKAEVENPELTKRMRMKDKVDFGKTESKRGKVDSLDDDGLPYVGATLQSGDIVIGKVSENGEDHSVKLRHTETGKVQKVVMSANDEGKNFAVVTLRQVRSPCLGDKFSSMHGQKGVVGFLESQENFAFTREGIVPDIVINPHAFPTRQTPGQLLEAALGKGICLKEESTRYATPFSTASPDDIMHQLHSAGYTRWGSEKMINGRTGEMIKSLIFIGPTYYQRLIHMAEDKVKFRNTGPVHPLTRQPVADRKRFGGVKFGEMERDCLLAHGAASNLHERLFTLSDFSQIHICGNCKRAANVVMRPLPGGTKLRGPFCGFCESGESIVRVNVPYGAKLLYQELFSMGISLKFETEMC
ncbi:hypothetical protein LUZ60_003069 [Juncus effusus]|nr:hypothetical protein LUZ60_003069 [Juncus effusus]